jgi:hypothetical protein
MSGYSGVGYFAGGICADPKWVDVSVGLVWAVLLHNGSGADITTGTVHIQTASALANDPCSPDPATWADLALYPECSSDPNAVTTPATITFSATNPLKDKATCEYSAECPKQFIKVTGAPTGVDAICVVSRLKRAGIPGNPAKFAPH